MTLLLYSRPLHIDYFPLQPEADLAELMQIGHAQQELTRALVDCNPPLWLVWLFDDLDSTHWNRPVSTQLAPVRDHGAGRRPPVKLNVPASGLEARQCVISGGA